MDMIELRQSGFNKQRFETAAVGNKIKRTRTNLVKRS